jgi:lipoprotein signal peptidase
MEQTTGIRGAENWQFFAFVFVAVIILAFSLINELRRPFWRIVLKLVAFALIGYLTLFDTWVQGRLVDLLHVAKGLKNR